MFYFKSIINKILILSFGGYTSKIITFFFLPFLTRMYLPGEFGLLAIYILLTSIFLIISSLRYELVIVQVKKKEDALSIIILSLILNFFVSIFVFFLIYLYFEFNSDILNIIIIKKFLYLIPFNIFFLGSLNIIKNWYIRCEEYKKISFLEIIQFSSISVFQIILGFFSIDQGLIVGYFLSSLLIFLIFLIEFFKIFNGKFKFESKKIFYNAKRFYEFPTYSALGAFADRLSTSIPLIFINKIFTSDIVGMYSLSFRVLQFPLTTISWSITNVIYKYISNFNNQDPKSTKPFVLKLTSILIIISIPFIIFFSIYGKEIFIFVFGNEWAYAGELSELIIIIVAIRFCVSPMSRVLLLNKNNKLGMIWQILYLFTTIFLFSFIFYNSIEDIEFILHIYILHELVLYIIYYVLILMKVEVKKK